MPARRGTRSSYGKSSLLVISNAEKAISEHWHKVKPPVNIGFTGRTLTYTVPTTPPASSSEESLPSLSTTPSSNNNSLIHTPETVSQAMLRRYPYFPEQESPTLETYLGNAGNQKSLCWTSKPVPEPVVIGNKLDLKIEQFLRHPEPSNKNTRDHLVQGVETRESYPIFPDSQLTQQIARPCTPEHQIIRPYCAPAETKSWHSPSQALARQGLSASPPRHYRSSLPSVSKVEKLITVSQRCARHRAYGRNCNCHLREDQRESCVLSKENFRALKASEKPSIETWILECEISSSSSDTSSICPFESDSTFENLGEEARPSFSEERTNYIAPIVQQAGPKDFIELARNYLGHLPDNTVTPLLASLAVLFKSKIYELTAGQSTTNISSSSGSFESFQYGTAPENSISISNRKKRTSRDDEDEMPDTDDEDRRKKQKLTGESKTKNPQKWACPFYQREPHRYCVKTKFGDFRKCARSPGFNDVHRVKAHIKDCHSPKYCDRCLTHFKEDDDLETHRRSVPACDLKDSQSLEGLSTKQQEKLRPRDKKQGKSEIDRWNTIYEICFPKDPKPPSPYYVHYTQEVAETRREVLEAIRQETRLPNEFNANRLLQRVDEAFARRMSANNPTTSIAQTPLLLTPSSHNSSNSTGFSSQNQARDTYIASPTVKHYSGRVALATGSVNTLIPSHEHLKPTDLPRPSNGNQACSSDLSQSVDHARIPIPQFHDTLHLEENQFDMALNNTTNQLDPTVYNPLFYDYEGFDMSGGDDNTNLFGSSQDNR